jgi:hypothetical protein
VRRLCRAVTPRAVGAAVPQATPLLVTFCAGPSWLSGTDRGLHPLHRVAPINPPQAISDYFKIHSRVGPFDGCRWVHRVQIHGFAHPLGGSTAYRGLSTWLSRPARTSFQPPAYRPCLNCNHLPSERRKAASVLV